MSSAHTCRRARHTHTRSNADVGEKTNVRTDVLALIATTRHPLRIRRALMQLRVGSCAGGGPVPEGEVGVSERLCGLCAADGVLVVDSNAKMLCGQYSKAAHHMRAKT